MTNCLAAIARRFRLATSLLVLAFFSFPAFPQNADAFARFQIEAIRSRMSSSQLTTAVIANDPVFNGSRSYAGYPLPLVFKTLQVHASPAAWVRFVCRDGYAPEIPLKKVWDGSPFLALKSLDKQAQGAWEPLLKDGRRISLGPAYLVWSKPDQRPDEFPWPYQIVSIELFNGQPASLAVSAGAKEGARAGFKIVTARCLKCHSLNGYGGVMGPELLSPCSVTQYWNSAFLKSYIRAPQSVRAQAKMPPNKDLSDRDLLNVIAYLEYLTSRKKESSSEHCPVR